MIQKKKFKVHIELDFTIDDVNKSQCFERFSRIARSYPDSKFDISFSQDKPFDWFKPL